MKSSIQESKSKFNLYLIFKKYMYEVYSLLLLNGVHKLLVETVISWLMQFLKIHVENVKNKENVKALPLNGLLYSGNQRIPLFPTHTLYLSFFYMPAIGAPVYQVGIIPLARGIVILLECKFPWQE